MTPVRLATSRAKATHRESADQLAVNARERALEHVQALVHPGDGAVGDVAQVDVHRLVDEDDPAAVGRPEDPVAEARAELGDGALLARPVRVAGP